jgi:subtilisin family serine protease
MRFFCLTISVAAVLAIMGAARAEEYTYRFDPDAPIACESLLQTSIPGKYSGASIADYIGASRFYAAGYTGQNTVTANVEAGHIWGGASGHETLQFMPDDEQHFFTADGADGGVDRHATWVGMILGGRGTAGYQTGLAYGTDLRSGAIATNWALTPPNWSNSFIASWRTVFGAYDNFFAGDPADVINSSWGVTDAKGTALFTMVADSFSVQCPQTTLVVSAGNSGPGTNTVSGPASGWNSISVGALANDGANRYNAIASFSSRGPQSYYDPVYGTVSGVRAAVDLVAPGDNLTSAYYGGTTGGNRGNTADGGTDSYSAGVTGTSFSAPIVAGGVALLKSASKGQGLPTTSLDSRVVRAVLMNSADKDLPGWNNGQTVVNGVVTTTQSLDWTLGAGRLDLNTAYDQYLSGTTDVAGLSGGEILVQGWDYGQVDAIGAHNDYTFTQELLGGSFLDVTLSWFRHRTAADIAVTKDVAFANLDIDVYDAAFTSLIATSKSLYNSSEELHFTIPADGYYGLRVRYAGQMFGSVVGEEYGLAWSATAVPEPGGLAVIAAAGLCFLAYRRRQAAVRFDDGGDKRPAIKARP